MNIRAFTQTDRLRLEEVSIPIATTPCDLTLRALPGAESLHLSFAEGGKVVRRVEIPVDGSEPVHVRVESVEAGDVRFRSPGHGPLRLPPDERYAPAPPIAMPESAQSLDVAVLVDGTTRINLRQLLLQEETAWNELTEKVGTFLETLAGSYPDLRLGVLAFADQPMVRRDVPADDLQPLYHLYPQRREDRKLRHLGVETAVELMRGLNASSGGDFVDALADGLHAAGEMYWRAQARKLLFVFGDSPGPSIEHPIHPGADICVRDRDVDVEAMALHRRGIEIVTLYFDPSAEEIGLEDLEAHELLDDARRQYRRLASLPEVAFQASLFDPRKAAEAVLERPELVARGSAYGVLLGAPARDPSVAAPDVDTAASVAPVALS